MMQFTYTGKGVRNLPGQRCRDAFRSFDKRLFNHRTSKRLRIERSRPRCQSTTEQVELLQATIYGQSVQSDDRKLLVYFPGTDGTGNAISPQLPGLIGAGFDVRALYIPTSDRSDWEALTHEAVSVIKKLVQSHGNQKKVTLVAESFGGCLALRVAKEAPELLERMVLVNPATAFSNSWGGIMNLAASTRLLSIFPKPLYQVAQAVLLPFLVDKENVGELGIEAVQQMIDMAPPANRQEAELKTRSRKVKDPTPSLLQSLESHGPAAAGSWRLALLCSGNVSDLYLSSIKTPTLLISSAKDRLLNSLEEGARLERNLGNAMRVVLPRSGHTALLEEEVHLVDIMQSASFLPKDLVTSNSQNPTIPDTPFKRRGIETEPLQRRTRQYALNAIRKKSQPSEIHLRNSRALVPGLNWSRSAVASTSGTSAYDQGNELQKLPVQLLQEIEEKSTGSRSWRSDSQSNGNSNQDWSRRRWPNGNDRGSDGVLAGSASPEIYAQNGATRVPLNSISSAFSPQDGTSQSRVQPRSESSTDRPANGYFRSYRDSEEQTSVGEPKKSLEEQKEAPWGHPDPRFDQTIAVLSPFRELISPVVRGLENLPSASETTRPLLFVGNHARIGLYDMPYLIIELYLRRVKVRGLAHPAHWRGPLGSFFEFFGAVKASPRSAYKLLKNGEAVLLFPGGGREVNKRKGEEYQLFWSEEPDFVRMAAKLNALIIPFASVGGDEAFDLAMDSDEIINHPIFGGLAKNALKNMDPSLNISEAVPPMTKIPGLGIPSLFPIANLSRLYFRFMPVIDPKEGGDVIKNRDFACDVYAKVKEQVYAGIHELQEEQRTDPKNSLQARIIGQIGRFLPAFDVLR